MKYKHTAAIVFVAVAGSLSTWVFSKYSTDGEPATAFTLEVVGTFYRDGKLVGARHPDILAYREDGSSIYVRSYRAKDGTNVELRKIYDRPALKTYYVNSFVESVSTMPMVEKNASNLTETPRNCGQPEGAPTKSILGYKAVKAVRGSVKTPEDFASVTEAWVAPALRCSVLESALVDHGEVISKTQATSIRLGEPDAAMFLIPARYKEMSPKERLDAADVKLGRKAGESYDDLIKVMEERYQQAHGRVQ